VVAPARRGPVRARVNACARPARVGVRQWTADWVRSRDRAGVVSDVLRVASGVRRREDTWLSVAEEARAAKLFVERDAGRARGGSGRAVGYGARWHDGRGAK